MNCSNIWSLWKKELKSYFYTPIAYVFIGFFNVFMGIFFYSFLNLFLRYTQATQMGASPPNITIDTLAQAFYGNMHIMLMIFTAFFTFRIYTDEHRQNTFVLLATSPIKNIEIVLGKYLASLSILFLMLVLTLIYPLFLALYAEGGMQNGPDIGVVMLTYLALFLSGASYFALGSFFSSVFKSQLIALVATFVGCFAFWWVSIQANAIENEAVGAILRHVSITDQFKSFLRGSLELKGIVYFMSLISFFLFLNWRSLEWKAWRS